jgi:hypothetical protein
MHRFPSFAPYLASIVCDTVLMIGHVAHGVRVRSGTRVTQAPVTADRKANMRSSLERILPMH